MQLGPLNRGTEAGLGLAAAGLAVRWALGAADNLDRRCTGYGMHLLAAGQAVRQRRYN
jgi:hypothetical protein